MGLEHKTVRGLEQGIISGKSLPELELMNSERKFYEKYVEGIDLKDSDPKEKRAKENLREKRANRKNFDDLKEYSKIHGDLKIKKDIKTLMGLRAWSGEKYKTQRSEILETIIAKHAELSDWFDGAYVFQTTEYDDRVNHVDFVLEWEGDEDGEEPICLGVDVTVAENPKNLDKKADFIKEEIDKGKLGRVDYFTSGVDDEQKVLQKIPRVVLAMKQDTIDELCENALADSNGKMLSEDHNQLILIKEMIDQLEVQLEYVESNKLPNGGIIDKAINKLKEVFQNKKSSLNDRIIKRAAREYGAINFGKLMQL